MSAGARLGPGLVIFRGHRRDLFDERRDGPDLGVIHLDAGEARHAGHADAILYDPKNLASRLALCDLAEVCGTRPHAFREFLPIDTWRSMAGDATARGEGAGAGLNCCGIVQVGRRYRWRTAFNGRFANASYRPVDGLGIGLRSRDVVEASEEVNCACDQG